MNLNRMAADGWSPAFHGECIDTYNRRSTGRVMSAILTGIDFRNMHFVTIEHKQ